MGTTILNTQQFGGVQRDDIDVTTSTKSLITKVIQGTGLSISSTGADAGTGDVTINLGINGLTEDTSPDLTSDYIATYDNSGATHKKVLLNNVIKTDHLGKYTHSTTNSASATLTAVNLDTNIFEIGSSVTHDESSNNTRIYALGADGSYYYVTYSFNWSGGGGVILTSDLYKDGSTTIAGTATSAALTTMASTNTVQYSTLISLDQGEFIELRLAANLGTGTFSNIFISVEKVA